MTTDQPERLGQRRIGEHRVELLLMPSGLLRMIDHHPAVAATHEARSEELYLPAWAAALEQRPTDEEITHILEDGVRQVFP